MTGLLSNFPHLCTVRNQRTIKGSLGGRRNAPVVAATNVVCWEQQASNKEILEFEKRGKLIEKKIYFLTDPGVTEQSEILITDRGSGTIADPVKYYVKSESLPDASAGLGVVYKVMVDRNLGATRQ